MSTDDLGHDWIPAGEEDGHNVCRNCYACDHCTPASIVNAVCDA